MLCIALPHILQSMVFVSTTIAAKSSGETLCSKSQTVGFYASLDDPANVLHILLVCFRVASLVVEECQNVRILATVCQRWQKYRRTFSNCVRRANGMAKSATQEPLCVENIQGSPHWPRNSHDPGGHQPFWCHVADMIYACQNESYKENHLPEHRRHSIQAQHTQRWEGCAAGKGSTKSSLNRHTVHLKGNSNA